MEKYNENLESMFNGSLSELDEQELIMISGGKVPISTHLLRAVSGSFFGVCYWIGYGAEKLIEN